jgi:hypothetical protein
VDKWAYFFREAKNLSVVPLALAQGPFREALEVARATTFSAEEWDAYERAKMAEQDARGALTVARQEGKAEGKAESILLFLEARGLRVSAVQRERLLRCSDARTLEIWIQRAATVAEVEELWHPKAD